MVDLSPINPDKRVNGQDVLGQADAFMAGFYINDEPYPITAAGIHELTITSNIHLYMPMLRIVCNDPLARLSNEVSRFNPDTGRSAIGDGTKIRVAIGRTGDDDLLERKFRLYSTPRIQMNNNSPVVIMHAVTDAYKWWRGMAQGAYKNTSMNAILDMAQECELGMVAPHTTNDSMAWMPNHQTFCQFANYITRHAWASNGSCMAGALDVDRIFRFVDVAQLASAKPIIKAVYLREGKENEKVLNVLELKISTDGGGNLAGGYASRLSGKTVDGDNFEFDEADVVKHGNFLDLNQDLKKEIGFSRSRLMTMDAGNTHENFAIARYQNERIGQTYRINIDIYIEQSSRAKLFDVIDLDMADHINGGDQNNFSGSYFVTAKAYGLNGGRYFEKLRLTSNSRNINANGRLV